MKDEKIEKGRLRISPKLIALLLAGGIALTPIAGSAVTDNSYKPGTFVKHVEQVEDARYGIYIVKEGDNASRISEKICSHERIEITTKYWPVVKYLNPEVLNEGDQIIFPLDPNEMDEILKQLKKGWLANYINTHNVYPKVEKKKISYEDAAKLIAEFYQGEDVCIDPDFVRLYMKATGLDKKYKLSKSKELTNDDKANFSDWIPTLEELEEYRKANKPKTKVKNKNNN